MRLLEPRPAFDQIGSDRNEDIGPRSSQAQADVISGVAGPVV
jgi:hypothetical protein